MDPITVLSVASSVVALVDFGGKLVTRAFEISRSPSGQPHGVADILQTSKELTAMAAEARGKVRGLEARYPRHATLIEQINIECADIEKQLRRALEKLTVNPLSKGLARASSQVTVTIRSAWSSRQLENLSSKIDGIRNRVMMSVIMCLLDEVQQTQNHVKTSGEESQSVLEALARVESKLDAIHSRSTTGSFNTGRIPSGPMIDTLWTWSELLDLPVQLANPLPDPWSEIKTQEGWKEKILESLAFDGMISRRDRIKAAFPDTFKWLFSAEEDFGVNSKASRLFTDWLEAETDKAFWITGKPASGKSTLMKFIATHSSLMDHLRVWADEKDLLVAYFYFWRPGTAMEKSWVGLFRSLLYQLLSQRPDLCESVAIRRQALFSVAGIENESPEWTLPELRECLSRLTSKVQGNSRLVLFIDGLDEFGGHHTELVSFFKGLQQNHGIKICVSSRPWNDFSDAFRQHPMLQMEDLTKPDVDKYISARFAKSLALQELKAVNPESIKTLRKAIADRAEGVFLWVAIVVEQIVAKARQTPVLDEIWVIFNSLPADLDALYRRIHDDLDPEMREASSRIYRIVLAWKLHIGDGIDAVHFWLAFNCKDYGLLVVFPDVSDHHAIARPVKRLLAGHTKGLLETIPQGKTRSSTTAIDFLHRTAFDWLQLPEQTQDLRTYSPGFEPLLPIMVAYGGYLRHFMSTDKRLGHFMRTDKVHPQHFTTTEEGRTGSPIGNMWARFFHICSQVDYLAAPEKTLISIVNQFQFQEDALKTAPAVLPPDSESGDWADGRSIPDPLGTLAATYCCRAYLYARIRADQSYLRTRPYLLEAVVLGIGSDVEHWREGELDLRLATVNLLIDHGAKTSRRLKKLVLNKFQDSRTLREEPLYAQYWDTVANIIQRRQDLTGNARKSWSPIRFFFNHTHETPSQSTEYAQPRTFEPLTFREIDLRTPSARRNAFEGFTRY